MGQPQPGDQFRHYKDPTTIYRVVGYTFDTQRQGVSIKYEPLGGPKREFLDSVGASDFSRPLYGEDGWFTPTGDGRTRFVPC